MRRFGDSPVKGQQYQLRPGAYAILPLGRNMLVTQQIKPNNEFQLPGGGIDAGESSIQALHREVFEETGWRIASPRRLGAFRKFTYMPDYDMWAEKLCKVFVARPVRRHGPPSEQGHSAVWMSVTTAMDALAVDGDRHFVQSAFS